MKKYPHNNNQQITKPINLKSLSTKFALRFLNALNKINHNSPKAAANGCNKVKVAADVSLALAVGPRRAWSRAMMLRVRARRLSGRRFIRRRRPVGPARAHELRRLVPGGESMDLQNLLDETAHYIKCLTTQVKVMKSIVNYCSTP